MKKFNNAIRETLAASKDDLRVMLAEKGSMMEEKRIVEAKRKRGPRPKGMA